MRNFGEEIGQNIFKDDKVKALLNIMYTANWIRDNHAPVFKEYGILQQHYNILRIVRGKKGECVTPGEILKVMLDKGRDLTRLVDKLVKIGYLKREQCPENRRRVNITLTDKGSQITEDIDAKLGRWIEANIKMSSGGTGTLNALLDQMRNAD